MVWVTGAQYVDGYRIEVLFNDGARGIVDLNDTIFNDHREVFKQVRDKGVFQRFAVDLDTIVWENGLDLAPEFLYHLATIGSTTHEASRG